MIAQVEQSHQKQQNNHEKQVEKYVYHDEEGDTYERSVVDITAADSFNEHIADKENAFCAQFTQKSEQYTLMISIYLSCELIKVFKHLDGRGRPFVLFLSISMV